MISSGTAMYCAYCGRPATALVWAGGLGYHEECLHGPNYRRPTYAPMEPSPYRQYVPTILTEDDVRRIVREELAKGAP